MAQKTYCGIGNIARQVPDKGYGGDDNEIARKLIKGYCGDSNNIARQFWGALGYVIFDNGEWHYVPTGFNLTQNYVETNGKIVDLEPYYLTNKVLWVHETIVHDQWIVDNDNYLSSNYSDYTEQIIKNEIYIPVNTILNPKRLRIVAKGNLKFNGYDITGNRLMNTMYQDTMICNNDLQVKEMVIEANGWIDYVKVTAPASYYAKYEEVQTNLPQPVPFAKNHIFSNDASRVPYPAIDIEKTSGNSNVNIVAVYREPNGGQTRFFLFSKEPFEALFTNRIWNGGTTPSYTTLTGDNLIYNLDGHTIYTVGSTGGIELANYGYRVVNADEYHCNYTGGWDNTLSQQLGLIVLYGLDNWLEPLPGVFDALQLIKRIEVIGGELAE